jgi:gamma-glutamyltranspeptidase/glutathione hydrolase
VTISEMIATRSEVAAERGVVSAGHPLEVEAGLAALHAGGNAIDATVAAAFAGFVVEPASCGLGGYGRLAIRLGDSGRFVTIDHYARAPAAARAGMFSVDPTKPMKYYGFPHTQGMQAEIGTSAPAVPGAVAGLIAAHEMFGRLKLARLLEPAIGYAEAGIPVDWVLQFTIGARLAEIRRHQAAAEFLLRDGAPPKAEGPFGPGDRLDTSALAATLRRIATQGAAGFHDGPVADAIARACTVLTAEDLRSYRPRALAEKPTPYRGHQVATAFDQVGIGALNILSAFDLPALGRDSLEFRHLMLEALACAFVDNMTHYGDPDFEKSPVEGLASPAFGRSRAGMLRLDAALPRPVAAADPWPFQDETLKPEKLPDRPSAARLAGTSQMAAADREGNVTSLITSLSSSFGSLVYVPEVGVWLNNAMQNFDPRPGLMNSIRPGKMPIFAAPALVASGAGRAAFAACGSGGYRIETGVLHAFVHAADFGLSVQQAIDAPRVHCQGEDSFVDARLPPEIRERLAAMGHRIVVQQDLPGTNCFGRVCGVAIMPDGSLRAGSGPAWNSAAGGY